MKTKIIGIALFILWTSTIFAQCQTETINLYPSVKVGTQTWMATDWTNADSEFISWNEAMNSSIHEKSQGICPLNWHIPTEEEWTILSDYLSENPMFASQVFKENQSVFGIRYSGTVDKNNKPMFVGSEAMYWTSTGIDNQKAFYVTLTKNGEVHSVVTNKNAKFTVRCIENNKDETVSEIIKL